MGDDRAFRFGPFCLRPEERLLLDADTPVHIGIRALEVLILLVERAGEVVTKEELFAHVWPRLTVGEGNLRTQVRLLRKALRDGQAGARYILSVPGRGYRFIAPLAVAEAAKPVQPPAARIETWTGLPIRLTRLIGRDDAVSDIAERLGARRFVTITGPGGIGKTSVAMAVAEAAVSGYADGVYFVNCAPLLGAALVARKLASTLGLDFAEDDPTRGLIAYLSNRRALIVLDCCDRVVEAAAFLAEDLLRGSRQVSILATSREALRAEGENVYRLPPLEIPHASTGLVADEALTYSAVQLFLERVRGSVRHFEPGEADPVVVAEICRKLDGIPLAIELAAGRVAVFGLSGVAARLEDRLRFLTHGRRTALPRHQTLAATLDWSYDALDELEQATLRRLSVFAGGFTIESAQAVAVDDLLGSSDIVEIVGSLVSKSLVNFEVSGAFAHYRLLDTTRVYALQKLEENSEYDQTYRRHAAHIGVQVEKVHAEAMTLMLAGQAKMSAQSGLIDELRVAINWAFSHRADIRTGITLTLAGIPLWTNLSLNGECRWHVEQALHAGKPILGPNDPREMQLLAALGAALIYTKGSGSEVEAAFAAALEIAVALDDADYQMRILWGLWSSHFNSGRIRLSLDTAKKFRDVAAAHGDTASQLVGERTIGMSLFYLGQHAEARRHTELMLDRYSRPGDSSHIVRFQFDPRIVARTLHSKLLWAQGLPDRAMHEVHAAVEEAANVGHAMSLALALAQGACAVSLLSGDLTATERYVDRLLGHTADNGLHLWNAWGRCFGAMLDIARGSTEAGLKRLRALLGELPSGAFFRHYAGIHATLAETLGQVGEQSLAHSVIDAALARSERYEELWYVAEFLRIKGELLGQGSMLNSTVEAEEQFRASLDVARRQQALSWELRTSISLARLYRQQGQNAEARDTLAPVHERFTQGFQTADLMAARVLLETLN